MAGIDEASASPRVNQYETGKRNPDPSTAKRLARVLGVPTPYLYAEDDVLASWILAFDLVTPTVRTKVLRKIEGVLRRKSSRGQTG